MWKLLIDKKITQAQLRRAAHIAPNTMTKLRRDEPVSLDVLARCCEVLGCNFGDLMDYISEKNNEGRNLNNEKV